MNAYRLLVPYQAGLEYQQRRIDVIIQQEKTYDETLDSLKKVFDDIKNKLASRKHPFIPQSEKITEKIEGLFKEIEEKIGEGKNQFTTLIENDYIRDELTQLLEGKISSPYDEKKLEELYAKGKKRYERKIPPGYADEKNKDYNREFGDLIFWFKTIEYAKEKQSSIILVTDEKKEDWWLKFQGKIIGPRPELTEEIKKLSSVSFYMYRVDPFMEHAGKYLKQTIKPEAITEVREARQRDDEKLNVNDVIATLFDDRIDRYSFIPKTCGKTYFDLIKKELAKNRHFNDIISTEKYLREIFDNPEDFTDEMRSKAIDKVLEELIKRDLKKYSSEKSNIIDGKLGFKNNVVW